MSSTFQNQRVLNQPAADVCVVGAGPAGITLARALGHAGLSVTLLESGAGNGSAREQELNEGDVEGQPYAGLRNTRARGLGGTANIWNVEIGSNPGAKYAPLDECDLNTWPIAWSELAPYYATGQDVCGIGRFAYDAADWADTTHQAFDLSGTGLCNRVYQFGSAARFTRELRDELNRIDKVRIVTSATVVGLMLDATQQCVRGVRIADDAGAVSEMRANRVVLACGAVENARLLLLEGLGARSPWLGCGFMEHARDFSLSLVPDSPELFSRASFYDLQTARCGTMVGGRVALHADAIERFDIPNASITLIPHESPAARASLLQRLLRRVSGSSPRASSRYGWSRQPDRAFSEFKMVLNLEQLPDVQNRISLRSRHDRFNNPLPHLALAWSDHEQARLERLRELLRDWFLTAGLGTLRTERGRRPDLSAHHHAGTTRMAERASEGVVDVNGAVFGLENLYVTGASLMPTAGFANPTLTIVALALKLARHLSS